MSTNKHGQPLNPAFNFCRNKEKSINGLKGILSGITADQKLNELEFLFLDTWLKEQSSLKNDGDVIDLLDLIGDILKDGTINSEELRELHSLAEDIIEFKEAGILETEDQINEFAGLLIGISADNKVNDLEISKVIEWLLENPGVKNEWPVNIVAEQLHKILADGIATQDEREHFLNVIKQITGIRFEESGVAYGMATEFFEDNITDLNHNNSAICFTGTFVTGTRSTVQKTAKNKGAVIKENVTKNLDYLVIGTLASRDWRFTSHGRKIEKALALKKSGCKITIINERTWLKHT
jgi:NAD-dependent DNA ligase